MYVALTTVCSICILATLAHIVLIAGEIARGSRQTGRPEEGGPGEEQGPAEVGGGEAREGEREGRAFSRREGGGTQGGQVPQTQPRCCSKGVWKVDWPNTLKCLQGHPQCKAVDGNSLTHLYYPVLVLLKMEAANPALKPQTFILSGIQWNPSNLDTILGQK